MSLASHQKILTPPRCWQQMPWGHHYRQTLEHQLRPWFAKMFGFHLLKIGELSAEIDTSACAIAHQVNVLEQPVNAHVVACATQLPFAAKSVDACLLSQSLSWCAQPHRLLREADRVLVDDGWLVLSSFNPWSLIGAGQFVPYWRRRAPYNSRLYSMVRLADWLALLNFQVLYRGCAHVLPWRKTGGRWPGTHLPALGCLQLMVARKRTFPLTLLPQARRQARVQLRPVVSANRLAGQRQPQVRR